MRLSLLPLAAAAALALFATPSRAAVTTTGCANTNVSCTLVELMMGGSIQTNGLIFSDFTPINVLGFGYGYGPYPDTREIDVFGLDDGGLDPGPGLLFVLNGQWDVSGMGLIDFETTFNVRTTGSLIKDSSVELDPSTSATGPGAQAGVENYLFEYAGGPPIHRLVTDIRPSDGFEVLYTETDFTPVDLVHGVLTFRVNGGGGTGSAYLDQFTLRFSQVETFDTVPEPTSLTLLAGGVLALLWARKRKQAV